MSYNDDLEEIPVPKCICLYNGEDRKTEECFELKLSTAFKNKKDGDIEVWVTCYNVNYDTRKKLLRDCRPLNEYAWFVEETRKNTKAGDELENAINNALSDMPEDFLIKKMLISNKAEVLDMCITEYNEAETFTLFGAQKEAKGRAEGEAIGEARGRAEGEAIGEARGRAEGEAIGEARGRAEEKINTLSELVKNGLLSVEDAAKTAGMSVSEFSEKAGLKVS